VVGVTVSTPSMDVYLPSRPKDAELPVIIVRVAGRPEDCVRLIEEAARSVDPGIRPTVHIAHAEYERSIQNRLFAIEGFSALGTITMLLAAIGLAGLTGYLVAQRTREIGVRMALGANRIQILAAVLRPAALALTIGLAAGMPGGAALGAIMRSELSGLSPLDPATNAAAIAIFTAVMALAAFIPARRAINVNPSEALRHE